MYIYLLSLKFGDSLGMGNEVLTYSPAKEQVVAQLVGSVALLTDGHVYVVVGVWVGGPDAELGSEDGRDRWAWMLKVWG